MKFKEAWDRQGGPSAGENKSLRSESPPVTEREEADVERAALWSSKSPDVGISRLTSQAQRLPVGGEDML